LLGLVSGCVSLEPGFDPDELEFRVAGKLAVRNGGEAFSANFVWEHAVSGYQIEFWGPLGQGRTKLVGRLGPASTLTIHMPDGETISDDDVEQLMHQALGWSAPVEVLPEWIRGRTAPEWPVAELQRGDDGSLQFEQLGWRVSLNGFREVGGESLPGRLVAKREESRITILMREWG